MKFSLPQEHLAHVYTRILTNPVTVWFVSTTSNELTRQHIDRLLLKGLYFSRLRNEWGKNITDPLHSGQYIFELLPSSRHFRSMCNKTARHQKSFFPHAVIDMMVASVLAIVFWCSILLCVIYIFST